MLLTDTESVYFIRRTFSGQQDHQPPSALSLSRSKCVCIIITVIITIIRSVLLHMRGERKGKNRLYSLHSHTAASFHTVQFGNCALALQLKSHPFRGKLQFVHLVYVTTLLVEVRRAHRVVHVCVCVCVCGSGSPRREEDQSSPGFFPSEI